MYPTVYLKDEQPGALHKVVPEGRQEEVVVDDGLAFLELVLRAVKVVVYKKVLEELSDGVGVPMGRWGSGTRLIDGRTSE